MKYLMTYENYSIVIKIQMENPTQDISENPELNSQISEIEGDDLVGVLMTGDDLDVLSQNPNVSIEN